MKVDLKGRWLSLWAVFLFAFLWPEPAICGKIYVAADTKIELILKTPISTSDEKPPLLSEIMEISSSDSIAGIEVFRKGGRIFGEITEFSKPGHLGKAGSLKIRIDSLQTVQGKIVVIKPVSLSASGKSKRLKAFLMLPLLGSGYFVKGSDAVLGEKGMIIPVRTAKFEEITF
jgi:hypothetical protein